MSEWIKGEALETVVRLKAIQPGDELLHRTRGVCVVTALITEWPVSWPARYDPDSASAVKVYQSGEGMHPDGRELAPGDYIISWGMVDGWRRPVKP